MQNQINSKLKELLEFSNDKLKKFNRIFISTSLGRMSSVVFILAEELKINFDAYWVDTGLNSINTLNYKKYLQKRFKIKIHRLKSNYLDFYLNDYDLPHRSLNNPLFTSLCNEIKIKPLEKHLASNNYDLWISNLNKFENTERQNLNIFEKKKNFMKYYPFLNWSKKEVFYLTKIFDIKLNENYHDFCKIDDNECGIHNIK